MSDNTLIYDKNNSALNAQRVGNGNCINLASNKNLNVNYKAGVHDDRCYVDIQTRQSIGPGNYQVTNLYDCDCLIPTVTDTATNQPLLFFKNGQDVGACVIDESTRMRIGLTRRFPRCRQQLFERPYLTVPYAGRGPGNMNIESMLQPGENTATRKSCNSLSGVTIPNYFTPLIDHLEYNVQNPRHIVQEVVDDSWRRGGAPSRLVVRDVDYLERCNKQYMQPPLNAEFWVNKTGLL